MLARSVTTIQGLLLCLVIVRNAVVCLDIDDRPLRIVKREVANIPSIPQSSNVSKTPSPSFQPRVLKRTTVKFLEKQQNPVNATLVKKITEDIDEDDDTTVITTAIPSVASFESSSMKPMDFRPSTHIGEIYDYQSRKSTLGPFNNVQHVKFENSVSIEDSDIGRVPAPLSSSKPSSIFDGAERARNRIKSYDTDGRYGVAVPIEYYVSPQVSTGQHQTEEIVENEDDNNDHDNNYNQFMPTIMGHEGVVTIEHPGTHYYVDVSAKPMTLSKPVYPSTMTDHKLQHLHQYEPSMYNAPTIHSKPSKFHGEVVTSVPAVHLQHYEYAAPAVGVGDIEKPEFMRHHPESYRFVAQPIHTDGIAKPETVFLISSHRETAITKARKFPYKFHYPPNVGHHDREYYYVSEGRHSYPVRERRISPWAKIIHLIGAFLPFGLLLALLKPNVLRVGAPNSTRPNDVLSTLRDLPVEHKNGRLENSPNDTREDTCEDKSICELIVSGSNPQANLLQNILWNFTYNSNDDEAKKHGLHEIFAAVKQKNCSYIAC